MALSDANKAKVRRYLGYPDVNRASYDEVENAMTALSAEGEAVVTGILTQLDAVDTGLQAEWSYLRVQRAEDVTLDSPGAVRSLRAEGRRLACELGAVFDLEPRRDIFSGASGSGVARRGA